MFLVILATIAIGNALWWRWMDQRARLLKPVKLWRILVGVFAGFQILYLALFVFVPSIARRSHAFPMPLMVVVYIWNLLILPIMTIEIAIRMIVRRVRKRQAAKHGDPVGPEMTRRQWLNAAAISVPPLFAGGTAMWAMSRLGRLQTRLMDVPVANLPPELEGLTIAHVSDTHIGKFTKPWMMDRVVEMTNQLRCDLVIFTGDLIDLSLGDFDAGVDVIHRLDPHEGLVMIEGNHDLIDDPDEFERRAKEVKLPILLDETTTMKIRGVPIQFLGIRWGKPTDGPRRKSNNTVIRENIENILKQRDTSAFPILLTHHPHGFDPAIDANLPLTLSGHTHGGQLMLTERLGAGPVLFKYWSGLYQHGNSSLVVSNGAGNWFPLRINAPAEVTRLTLRRA
jgi:predicted MPP superfamily phosphohydrolase